MSKNRDKNILKHIIEYCDQTEEAVALFGDNYIRFTCLKILLSKTYFAI